MTEMVELSKNATPSLRGRGRKRKRSPSQTDNKCKTKNFSMVIKAIGDRCEICLNTSGSNLYGDLEPLYQCAGHCGVSLHHSCLAIHCGSRSKLLTKGSRWFCKNCGTCASESPCPESVGRMACLLKCNRCNNKFHIECLQPPIDTAKPASAWRCPFCIVNHDAVVSSESETFGERHGEAFKTKRQDHRPGNWIVYLESMSSKRKSRLLESNKTETNHLLFPKNEKKRKRTAEDSVIQLEKKKCVKPSISGFKYVCDLTEDVLENVKHPISNLSSGNSVKISEETKATTKNRTTQAPIRCPAVIQFGKFKVKTWFSTQFPQEHDPKKLMFCEYCLKYTQCESVLRRHMRCCNWRTPPGVEIYRNGHLSVFEVDGNIDKIYCETLCRIAKLFLDLKTLAYGVKPFRFYILTKNDGFGNHLVGFFSKTKDKVENFNVACIMVMPQYQRKGYGRLLIEFSYLLSKIEKQPGTPETPLSDLGQKSYNSYWKSVILEYLDKYRKSSKKYIKICIDNVINKTGLIEQDIINTLNSLNFVVEVFNRTTICIDWNVVDAHMQKKKKSKKIHIDQKKLNWTP